MALGKSGMQRRIAKSLDGVLAPGEKAVASLQGVAGPSIWLVILLLGPLGMLLLWRWHFVTITESRIILQPLSMLSGRPNGTPVIAARSQCELSNYRRGLLWGSFRYQGPGFLDGKRFNVARLWRAEADQLMEAASARTDTAPA
jgi:hypothetical protein